MGKSDAYKKNILQNPWRRAKTTDKSDLLLCLFILLLCFFSVGLHRFCLKIEILMLAKLFKSFKNIAKLSAKISWPTNS